VKFNFYITVNENMKQFLENKNIERTELGKSPAWVVIAIEDK
jgi:hypothetical protein